MHRRPLDEQVTPPVVRDPSRSILGSNLLLGSPGPFDNHGIPFPPEPGRSGIRIRPEDDGPVGPVALPVRTVPERKHGCTVDRELGDRPRRRVDRHLAGVDDAVLDRDRSRRRDRRRHLPDDTPAVGRSSHRRRPSVRDDPDGIVVRLVGDLGNLGCEPEAVTAEQVERRPFRPVDDDPGEFGEEIHPGLRAQAGDAGAGRGKLEPYADPGSRGHRRGPMFHPVRAAPVRGGSKRAGLARSAGSCARSAPTVIHRR